MTDQLTYEQIQGEMNQKIYNDLVYYNNLLIELIEKDKAYHIIISALATNLGAILAQSPDKYREDFIKIANDIVNASMTETIKTVDNANWGQIGHA